MIRALGAGASVSQSTEPTADSGGVGSQPLDLLTRAAIMDQLMDLGPHGISLSGSGPLPFDELSNPPPISEADVQATAAAAAAAASAAAAAAAAASAAAADASSSVTNDRMTPSIGGGGVGGGSSGGATAVVAWNTKHCIAPGCFTRPSYGMPGSKQSHCAQHKLRGMVDVCSKICHEPT